MLLTYNDFVDRQHQASAFAQRCFSRITTQIVRPDFPCYFARKVLPKNSLYLAFIEDFSSRDELFALACQVFAQYAEIEKTPDPYRVLVLTLNVATQSWADDNELMWAFMHYLQAHDPEPWAQGVSTNTNDAGWSFSFMGMPWFFNLNSHNHQHRNSRNISGSFSLILQRTDSFEKLLGAELDDDKREHQRQVIRKEIRGRIAAYDGQPASPALAGEPDNLQHLEWVQYHVPDLNTEKPQSACPFAALLAKPLNQ